MNLLRKNRIPNKLSRSSFHPACSIPCITTGPANASGAPANASGAPAHPCEDYFRLLFENNPNAMWLFDELTHAFLEVNQAACALYGFSREQFLQMNLTRIHPKGEIQKILQCLEEGEIPAKPAGVWEHHRKDGSSLHAQITFSPTRYKGRKAVLAVIHDVSALKRAEEELQQARAQLELRVRQRTAELERANAELRREFINKQRLERRILEVSESEQRKLGEDLHDDLGQQLTGMGLLASVLTTDLRKQSNPLAEEAQNLVNYLGEASLCARNLAKGLYPTSLDRGGFQQALNQMAQRISRVAKVQCEVRVEEGFKLPEECGIPCYRIIQEAVNNAIKHAKSRRIAIECKALPKALVFAVRNDGRPFQQPKRTPKGMGLSLMRHRARMMGARLVLRRGKEGGCEMICSLPKTISFGIQHRG